MKPRPAIERFLVSADQMRQIEGRLFGAGMPVAALMEKVAGQIARRLMALYPRCSKTDSEGRSQFFRMGIIVGPGHNGGDALVVARELYLQGYDIRLYRPLDKLKNLTAAHAQYATSLGIPTVERVDDLVDCTLIVDGLFGFGLTRALEGAIAALVQTINDWAIPVVSLDLPSGIHTDTGQPLGVAIQATRTLCLGLWKRAFVQDCALDFLGHAELIDFDIPLADIHAVLGQEPLVQRITPAAVRSRLPLPRRQATHKYKVGHLLLICGSRQFAGAALLAGLGTRASGVGM
ncbi:MAG: NAD(P)H-hydrate epimerase, partial [Cyanobacteria bacterium J06659_2]